MVSGGVEEPPGLRSIHRSMASAEHLVSPHLLSKLSLLVSSNSTLCPCRVDWKTRCSKCVLERPSLSRGISRARCNCIDIDWSEWDNFRVAGYRKRTIGSCRVCTYILRACVCVCILILDVVARFQRELRVYTHLSLRI